MANLPQSITLNLGSTYRVNKVRYLPRQDAGNGIITGYNIYTSIDGTNFTLVAQGSWNVDPLEKSTTFGAVTAKYVKLEATGGQGGFAAAAEINVEQLIY